MDGVSEEAICLRLKLELLLLNGSGVRHSLMGLLHSRDKLLLKSNGS